MHIESPRLLQPGLAIRALPSKHLHQRLSLLLLCEVGIFHRCQSTQTSIWMVGAICYVLHSYISQCLHSSIYNNIILPLANSWNQDEILDGVEGFLIILKPDVSNNSLIILTLSLWLIVYMKCFTTGLPSDI